MAAQLLEAFYCSKSLFDLASFTRTRGITWRVVSPNHIRVWITNGCLPSNPQSSRTYTVRHMVWFAQLLCWENLQGDCDTIFYQKVRKYQTVRRPFSTLFIGSCRVLQPSWPRLPVLRLPLSLRVSGSWQPSFLFRNRYMACSATCRPSNRVNRISVDSTTMLSWNLPFDSDTASVEQIRSSGFLLPYWWCQVWGSMEPGTCQHAALPPNRLV
jgi:hypothetical protein